MLLQVQFLDPICHFSNSNYVNIKKNIVFQINKKLHKVKILQLQPAVLYFDFEISFELILTI